MENELIDGAEELAGKTIEKCYKQKDEDLTTLIIVTTDGFTYQLIPDALFRDIEIQR